MYHKWYYIFNHHQKLGSAYVKPHICNNMSSLQRIYNFKIESSPSVAAKLAMLWFLSLLFSFNTWQNYQLLIRIQKRVIRSMVGVSSRTSCRQFFRELKILTLASLYTLEVTCFIRKYCQSLEQNSKVHKYNTRKKLDIHVKLQKN
jgi:hypothetical protein